MPRPDACLTASTSPRPSTRCAWQPTATSRASRADHEGFRWNTIVAKLMELTNVLMRYRGTPAAGTPGWDDAVRLLL